MQSKSTSLRSFTICWISDFVIEKFLINFIFVICRLILLFRWAKLISFDVILLFHWWISLLYFFKNMIFQRYALFIASLLPAADRTPYVFFLQELNRRVSVKYLRIDLVFKNLSTILCDFVIRNFDTPN